MSHREAGSRPAKNSACGAGQVGNLPHESASLVVHCKKEKYDVYIGRAVPRSGLKASIWGNPFVIGKDGTREEVMAKYRAWLLGNRGLLKKLPELKGKVLGCWCSPEGCHGDVLAELANRKD